MNYKNVESGRSMVEMLGVLAVIGVLSIAGIMGYSYGMDKYRANTTINDINLRRIDLMAQTENGNKNPTLDAWNDEKTLYPMTLVFDEDTDVPLIQVSNVPEQVCEMIVEDMETQAAITVNSYYIAEQEDGGCEETNDLTFYFGDYTVCGTEYCSGNTPICHPDSQTCVACLNSGDCPADTPICNASNMCEMCPANKPFYDASTGICGDCQNDADCSGGAICLNNNKAYTHYDNGPTLGGFNKCTSLSYETILTAKESPDGREWGYVAYIGPHRNAKKVCEHFGGTVASLSDYGLYCAPPDHCNKTPAATALYKNHNNYGPHIWAAEGQDDKGLLINLGVSETRMHPYYFKETANFGTYCLRKQNHLTGY